MDNKTPIDKVEDNKIPNNKEETSFLKVSATDRLANERTFLAWIRTALGIVAFGFVIVKFSLFLTQIRILGIIQGNGSQIIDTLSELQIKQSFANITGILMILLGCLILVSGYVRYQKVEKQLRKGILNENRLLPLLTTLFLVVVIVLMMVYLAL